MSVLIPLKRKYRLGQQRPSFKSSSNRSGVNRKSWMDEPMNAKQAAEHRARSRAGQPRTLVIRNGKRVWE